MKKTGLLFLLFASTFVRAQIPEPPKNIPSPNVYTFVQNTNVPISHFSGLPQISIPLGAINYKEINTPIALSYSYSGFKPEQHPGWVGLGWGLEVGGVITRTVKGEFPDEFDFDITPYLDYPNDKQPTRNGFIINAEFAPNTLRKKLLKSSPLFMDILLDGNVEHYIPLPHKLPYYPDGNTRYSPDAYRQSADPVRWLGEDITPSGAPNWFGGGGKKDVFSDEYRFSFMGISGKFIFKIVGGQVEIVIQSNSKVKIEAMGDRLKTPFTPVTSRLIGPTVDSYMYNYSAFFEEGKYPKTFAGFIITTDNGYKYYFGKNAEMFDNPNIQDPSNEYFNSVGIEYSISANNYATDYWTADSWYLTRVICADGRKIDFEYERKELILQEFKSYFSVNSLGSYAKVGRLVSPVYLKKISSDFLQCNFFISKSNELRPSMQTYNPNAPVGNVDFVYYINDPNNQINWYKLDSVQLSGNNIGLKKFKFQYNNTPTERLFLQKAIEYDNINNQMVHEFIYDNSKTLPNYLSSQTDHWGYWNGKSIVELNTTNLTSFLPAKESDFAYTIPGSLQKIKYPTGGEANFEYEQNAYSKYVPEIRTQPLVISNTQPIGGERIKKIIHYDPVMNKTASRRYFYTQIYNPSNNESVNASGTSSGISTQTSKYQWDGIGSEFMDLYSYSNELNTNYYPSTLNMLSDQSIFPQFDNYHVNYTKVFEVEENNGYKAFTYSNFDNGHGDDSPISVLNNLTSPYTKFSSKAIERGLLLETETYSQSNELVSKIENTYKPDYLSNGDLSYTSVDDGQIFPISGTSTEASSLPKLSALGSTYKFYTYRYLKDKETSYSYNQGKSLKNSTQYFYDNPAHGQISRINQLKSNGDSLITKISYPSDYTGFLPQRMVNNFYLSTPIDKKIILKQIANNSQSIISAELCEYKLIPGNSQDVWLKQVYRLDPTTPLALANYSGFTIDNIDWTSNPWTKDSRYREIMNITKYDNNKNILVYKSNGSSVSNGIGYDNKNLRPNIIGFGTNDSSPKYAFESFEDITLNGNITTSTSRTGSKSLFGTFVLTGRFVGLEYVYLDVWAKGASVPIVTYNTNITTNGYLTVQVGDWKLYRYALANYLLNNITVNSNGSYVDDVRALPLGTIGTFNTYTYSKGLLRASSNEREQLTFYEYDSFNRLQNVKDQDGNIIKSINYHFKN